MSKLWLWWGGASWWPFLHLTLSDKLSIYTFFWLAINIQSVLNVCWLFEVPQLGFIHMESRWTWTAVLFRSAESLFRDEKSQCTRSILTFDTRIPHRRCSINRSAWNSPIWHEAFRKSSAISRWHWSLYLCSVRRCHRITHNVCLRESGSKLIVACRREVTSDDG